jgi:hypothetical protein
MWEHNYLEIEKLIPVKDILYLKYEDLKNSFTRIATLKRVVEFLGLNYDTGTVYERVWCHMNMIRLLSSYKQYVHEIRIMIF